MTVADIIEKITELSPEDLAKPDQDDEDYNQGINISPCLKTDEEILSYLHQSNRE